LRDAVLIPQVIGHLSAHWRTRAGVSGPIDELTWPEVAQRLLAEDTARRQSDLTSREALLPLGFPDPPRTSSSSGHQGGARPAVGSTSPRATTPARPRPSGPGGRGGGGDSRGSSQSGSRGSAGSRARSPSSSPTRPSGTRTGQSTSPGRSAAGPLVCWHCRRSGHRWDACPTRESGWRPSAEDRAEGIRLSAQRGAQSRAAKAAASAARGGGGQSPARGRSSSPGRGRSPTRAGASSEGHASGSL
jgi:hypothetical protein